MNPLIVALIGFLSALLAYLIGVRVGRETARRDFLLRRRPGLEP